MAITAQHLAPQGGGFEPQRAFDFEVVLVGVPNAENVRLAVEQMFVPSMQNNTINIAYMGEDRKVAGRASAQGGSLVVKDFVDEGIAQALESWRKLVYNAETGAIGWARDYKKQAFLRLLAPDGTSPRTYKLEGVWPSNLTASNLSYSQSGVVQLTLALVFDRYFFQG